MRNLVALTAVLVAGLAWIAVPAHAQTQYPPPTSSQSGVSQQQPETAAQYPAQPYPGTSQQQRQSGTTGRSDSNVIASRYTAQVTGQVTNVDRQSGKLTLRTIDGDVNATFPPVAVQNVQPGDRVTLAIGLLETNMPSASPRMPSGTSNLPSSSPSRPSSPSTTR